MKWFLAFVLSLGAFASSSVTDVTDAALVTVVTYENPYVRTPPPGAIAGAGFVTLKNSSEADVEVLGAKAGFAKTTELHTHVVKNGIMQMRKVDKMVIPAKGELALKPHGNHLMFFGLQKELKEGSKTKVSFQLGNGESLEIPFEVKK